MIWYWIGLFLIVSGLLSLIFNEFTVRVRRIWPWRRDDQDPQRDAQLNEYYRLSVYAGSIFCIELGSYLAQLSLATWPWRMAIYLCFGIWLFWQRPALRRKAFWRNFHRRGVSDGARPDNS